MIPYTVLTFLIVIIHSTQSTGTTAIQRKVLNQQIKGQQSPQHGLADIDIIQNVLQGIFSQNKLEGPFMIKYCFNQTIAHQTVTFISDALDKAQKGSPKDLISLIQETKSFVTGLPESFIECLGKCEQIRNLGWKYDIDGSTDFQALQIKLTEYILLHYFEVHRWAIDLNTKWLQEYYFDVGYYGAIYAHKVQHGST